MSNWNRVRYIVWEIERESSIFQFHRFLPGSFSWRFREEKATFQHTMVTRKMALCGVWGPGVLWFYWCGKFHFHQPWTDIYTCIGHQPSVSLTCPFHQHVNRLWRSRRQSIIEFNCRLYLGDDDIVVIAGRQWWLWLSGGVLGSRKN